MFARFFSLTLIIIIPFLTFAQVDLTKGLVAYYPFNGNALDASGNGNNPVFNNATLTSDYYGNANSAYHFNGVDNYIQIPNSNSLNTGTDISVCAWVKPTGFYYGPCHGNSVLMKGNGDFQSGNYMIRFDDALYTGTNCDGGFPDTLHQTYYAIGTGLSPVQDTPYTQKNIWRSVVYTYDGSHARLYIDCNLILDTELSGLDFSNSSDLFFGRLNNSQFPYWLNGDLDELRIYNRVITTDEVKVYSFSCADKEPCNNWLKVNQEVSGVQIGDLDLNGNQLTIEALINRTTSFPVSYNGGDVVSKHDDPSDANYLLRPTVAQITTTNGFFQTHAACDIALNKTYHIAMVYDGKKLKFYRNGFLMSEVNASGNLYQNDWITKIGTTANTASPYPADFIGYINEVRIWNVARTQDNIKKYMNQSLPNPASQAGLLAYYTFDDLKNKQGNAQWDGSILGSADINQTNSKCDFVADSCNMQQCNLNAGFTYEQNTCDPKTVQFKDATSNADSIWWNFGDGKIAGNVKNPTHQYTELKNYIVKLFAKTNAGCLDTAIINIDVSIKKDSAIINNDTSVCAGSIVQLKAIKGLKYCWSPSAGLSDSSIQNPVATVQNTTKYYLNILSGNNQPVVQDSIIINIISSPVVNAGNDISICKGASAQLNASGANIYKWNASVDLSDTTIANPFATPSNTSQFIVKGFNAQGCFDTDTVKVSVLPLPDIKLTNDTGICINGSVMLQANVAGNNSYNWYPSAGLSNENIYNPVASPADSTKYFVTVTNNNNCKSIDSVTVNVLPKPIVAIMNDTSLCAGNSVLLKTTAANASVFSWSPTSGLNNTGVQNPEASPSTSTLYTVTAGNGICSAQDDILISVLSLPLVMASNDTIVCGNASAQLNTTGASSYSWYPVNGLSDAKISNPVATPGSTTTYHVTGTGNNSCPNVDSVTVTINPPPAFNIKPISSSLCAGDSVLLTATGGDIYNWLPAQTLSNNSLTNVEAHPLQNTTYQVTITNSACKVTSILTSSIVVKDLPTVTISKSNDIDCINFEAQLTATAGVSYRWSPSTNISSAYIPNPKVTPRINTRYFVVVKDANGCSNKDSVLVNSTNANADIARFEAASAFTPNHDGLNDCFNVRYFGTADAFDMAIYNRWGQLVFHSNDINKCWDGTFNGLAQSAGTYIYQISISSNCSKGLIHRKGTVVLVR